MTMMFLKILFEKQPNKVFIFKNLDLNPEIAETMKKKV